MVDLVLAWCLKASQKEAPKATSGHRVLLWMGEILRPASKPGGARRGNPVHPHVGFVLGGFQLVKPKRIQEQTGKPTGSPCKFRAGSPSFEEAQPTPSPARNGVFGRKPASKTRCERFEGSASSAGSKGSTWTWSIDSISCLGFKLTS